MVNKFASFEMITQFFLLHSTVFKYSLYILQKSFVKKVGKSVTALVMIFLFLISANKYCQARYQAGRY